MQLVFIAIVLLLGGAFVIGTACIPFSARYRGARRRLAATLGATLMAVGALGFFGNALSSLGGFNWLPRTFEWPVGNADGVVTMPDGTKVVPHTPSGRVQLYDNNWRFIRGWHVDAFGGTFRLLASGDEQFDVVTARRNVRYTYALNGNLNARSEYAEPEWNAFAQNGQQYSVPTSPWLWTFSHPFHAWAVAIVGMGILFALDGKTIRDRLPSRLRQR